LIILAALLSGAAAFGAVLFALTPVRQAWVRTRLAPHLGSTHRAPRRPARDVLAHVLDTTERGLGSTRLWGRLERLRVRAGVRWTTAEIVYATLGAAILLMLVLVLVGANTGAIVVAPIFTVGAMLAALNVKVQRRRAAFDEQLPDALEAMASALKVGQSLTQSLQVIAEEADKPIADEFDQLLAEARLGRPLEVAFQAVLDRVGSSELEFVITAVTVQRRVGGSLATLIETVAATVRRRQDYSRKLRSLTAMGRISARVLVVMPFVVAFLLTIINPGYMHPLYATSTGNLLVVLAVGMLAVGSLLLKRIVSLEV
jgi:tight adherence protein B